MEQKEFEELVKEAKLTIENQSLTNVTDILHTVSMLVYFKEKSLIFFSIESLLVLAINQYKKNVNLQENIKKFGYFDICDESGGYGLYARELPIFQKFLKDIAQAYEDKYIEKNANYWISRPPILVRGLPLIPIPNRPLKLKKISFYF